MSDVAMPRLSDSMEEGTILKWLKSDGDEVSKGEELVEIETDKANMTYEADESGTLEIVASEGDTLPVGETIARIGEGGGGEKQSEESDEGEDEQEESEAAEEPDEGDSEDDEGDEGKDDGEEEDEQAEEEPAAEEPDSEPEPEPDDDRIKASPIARRMAREQGIDLADIEGSGPGGRIVKADIEAASDGGEEQPAEEEPEAEAEAAPAGEPEEKEERKPAKDSGRGDVTHTELSRLQRTVARRMAESKATAPDFVMTLEVDMEAAVALRGELKAAAGDQPAPSFNDFVVKAAALALRDFPRANGAYRDGQFELYSRVNVGVAVAGQDALVVPTVFDADKKSLGAIAAESRRLAERVREGKITPPELSSGTFTVSNLGMYGIRRFVAVINPPQAAILAVGELSPRPAVRDGELVVRALMELTLTCDHRILYGADAAEFLAKIREYLEAPLKLAL
jgi:pyruvate dehydrogenase E2 component (dihydrolipoamide acetyltransferase)